MQRYRSLTVVAILAALMLLISALPQQSFALPAVDLSKKKNAISEHFLNDGSTLTIDSVDFTAKKKNTKTNGEIIVKLIQDGNVLAQDVISTSELPKKKFAKLTADLGDTEVSGNFDIQISFEGKGGIKVQRQKSMPSEMQSFIVAEKGPKKWHLALDINSTTDTSGNPGEQQPPAQTTATITVSANRIPSQYWASSFTEAGAKMYFVLYNSAGELIQNGFADENGYTFTGLENGATYYVYPTDCNTCHNDPHDVVFRYWEDNSTERPRAVVASDSGISVGAYYEFVKHPE